MQLDLAGTTGELSGFVTNVVGTNVVASRLAAQRTVTAVAGPAPYHAGTRRFVIASPEANGPVPVGTGTARIGLTGLVRFTGTWENGRRFVFDSGIGQGGSAPFYVSLSGGAEAVLGWVNFPAKSLNSISGGLDWLKTETGGATNSWSNLLLVPNSSQ
jgi:hypothetical protein